MPEFWFSLTRIYQCKDRIEGPVLTRLCSVFWQVLRSVGWNVLRDIIFYYHKNWTVTNLNNSVTFSYVISKNFIRAAFVKFILHKLQWRFNKNYHLFQHFQNSAKTFRNRKEKTHVFFFLFSKNLLLNIADFVKYWKIASVLPALNIFNLRDPGISNTLAVCVLMIWKPVIFFAIIFFSFGSAFICSKSTIETPERGVKYVQR